MNPFFRFSSSQAFKACSSLRDMAYNGPNGGVLPSISLMSWSYGRCGGSLSASFGEKTSSKSKSSGGSSFFRSGWSGRDSWRSMSSIVTENI